MGLKEEFRQTANELINDTFADAKVAFTASKEGKYNPVTDTIDQGVSYNFDAIPTDIIDAQNVFTNITSSDYFVTAYNGGVNAQDFDASFSATVDGKKMTITEVQTDAYDAAWFVRLAK